MALTPDAAFNRYLSEILASLEGMWDLVSLDFGEGRFGGRWRV